MRIERALSSLGSLRDKSLRITVRRGALSKVIGQKRINKTKLIAKFGLANLIFSESDSLSGYDFLIVEERTERCI